MPKKGYKQTKKHKVKINTPERARKISKTLKNLYSTGERVCWTKGKKLSEEHKKRIRENSKKGKDNHSWLGKRVSYYGTHQWIKKCFGNAVRCENREKPLLGFQCSKKSKKYEWAKKKGRRYSRNKNDYFQLCVSCHRKYDYIPKNRKCNVNGCNNKHYVHGYCIKHYRRFKKWGNPLAWKSHHNKIIYKI